MGFARSRRGQRGRHRRGGARHAWFPPGGHRTIGGRRFWRTRHSFRRLPKPRLSHQVRLHDSRDGAPVDRCRSLRSEDGARVLPIHAEDLARATFSARQTVSCFAQAFVQSRRPMSPITAQHLEKHGLPPAEARSMALKIDEALRQSNPAESWRIISKTILGPEHPFAVHRFLYETVFADWKREQGPPPAWSPTAADVEGANVTAIMRQLKLRSYAELHAWSVRNREAFWELAIERLGVRF